MLWADTSGNGRTTFVSCIEKRSKVLTIAIAALLTGAAQLIFLYNLIHARWWGPVAPDNPWDATSLEWSTTSPPPFDNFGGRHLVVHQGPYEYNAEGAAKDYVMQTDPDFVAKS